MKRKPKMEDQIRKFESLKNKEYAKDKKELLIKCETWKFAWMDFWKFREAFFEKYKTLPKEAL